MPPRTARQILAEWHELAMQRDAAAEATDTEITDGIAARIEQVRREYIGGTLPDEQSGSSDLDVAQGSAPTLPTVARPSIRLESNGEEGA